MTLRARLALWYAGTLAAALLGYGTFVYLTLERNLLAQLDREIHDDYEEVEDLVAFDAKAGGACWRPDFAPGGAQHPGEDADPGPALLVLGADGRTIHRDAAFVEDGSLRVGEWRHEARADAPATGSETVTIRVGRPLDAVRTQLGRLLAVLGLGLPLAVAAGAAGGYFLAGRALAPVGQMAERARAITADRLDRRLPVENPGDEIGRLAAVFNEALARLERSFEQMRRFTADASHELRTPLTAMRTVGEVGLREPRDPAGYREVVGSMLEEVERLSRLVESLLTLSRADAGQIRLARQPLDLSVLAREAASHLGVLAEEKRQALAVEAPVPVPVSADRTVLRLAVVNLLDNAVKYGPEGSTVRVTVAGADGEASLEVADAGPGIAEDQRDRVFDRFYRVDEGRSRDRGGVGLGLAIARWAVEAHGGRIDLRSEVGRGSSFRIVLPRGGGTEGGAR